MGDDISCGARSWMNKLPSQPIRSTARGHFLRNDQVDASDEPIRSTARVGATHSRATLPPAILSRHRSAPSRTAIDNDELDFRPPRAEYSANIRRSSPRVRASTLVPESREPMITILDTSSHTLPNDTSSRTSRVSFETRPPPLGLPSPSIKIPSITENSGHPNRFLPMRYRFHCREHLACSSLKLPMSSTLQHFHTMELTICRQ